MGSKTIKATSYDAAERQFRSDIKKFNRKNPSSKQTFSGLKKSKIRKGTYTGTTRRSRR